MDAQVTDQRTDRVLFVWLLVASLVGASVGIPFSIALARDSATVLPGWPVWLWAMVDALVEVLVFLAPASAVGVWLGRKVGLGSRLRELVSGMFGGWEHVRSDLLPAMLVGLTLGAIGFLAQNSIPKSALTTPGLSNPNTFEWFLKCLNAALTEEILFRLGLMTFFVWLLRFVVKKPAIDVPSLWIGNLLSALLFAGAHLPQLSFSHSWGLVITVAVVSSSIGMLMGWLYMRYGLVSAIAAHFITDLMMYVVPRLIAAGTSLDLRVIYLIVLLVALVAAILGIRLARRHAA